MDNIVLTDYVNNIPFIFFPTHEQMRSTILVELNISVKVGNRIVEVLIDANGYVVSELENTKHEYLEREQRDCKTYKKMKTETVRQKILGPNNPVKIIRLGLNMTGSIPLPSVSPANASNDSVL